MFRRRAVGMRQHRRRPGRAAIARAHQVDRVGIRAFSGFLQPVRDPVAVVQHHQRGKVGPVDEPACWRAIDARGGAVGDGAGRADRAVARDGGKAQARMVAAALLPGHDETAPRVHCNRGRDGASGSGEFDRLAFQRMQRRSDPRSDERKDDGQRAAGRAVGVRGHRGGAGGATGDHAIASAAARKRHRRRPAGSRHAAAATTAPRRRGRSPPRRCARTRPGPAGSSGRRRRRSWSACR